MKEQISGDTELTKLSQDITLMLKDKEILEASTGLLILASKNLIKKLNGPMDKIPMAAKRLSEAITLCEECISKF